MSRVKGPERPLGVQTDARRSAPLYADEMAGEGAPAIVLLHGFGGSHHVWDDVRAFLDPSRHVLAYDLPGHGRSLGIPAEGAAPSFAKALLADLATRNLGPIHLAGHSLGGAVAVLMALFEPSRIASLTLLAPGGFGPDINASLLHDFAQAASPEQLASCLRAMAVPEFTPSDAMIEQTVAERCVPGQIEALTSLYSRITRDGRQGAFTPQQLAALSMPAQLIWGERDPVLPIAQAQNVPASFKLHRQPGLGHMLPLEAPQAMARLISRFIG